MFVLRVLNGPLRGADIALPRDGCFVRVVDLDASSTHPSVDEGVDALSDGAVLTLPLAGGSPNFRLTAHEHRPGEWRMEAEVYEIASSTSHEVLALNAPVNVGGLRIAVREAGDVWSDAVLTDHGHHSLVRRPANAQRRRRGLAWGAVAAGVSTLSLAAWLVWSAPAPATNVSRLLAGQACAVAETDDHALYVIVHDEAVAGPIRRMLLRAGADDVNVRSRAQEEARLDKWLDAAGMPHFAADLSDPRRPVIVLRRKSTGQAVLPDDFESRLRQSFPYASGLDVQWRSDEDAQRAARSMAEEVGVRASYQVTPQHFAVTIDDYLSDAQLERLGRALGAYQRVWGKEYAQFIVNQRDLVPVNGLRTGHLGYELRGARHVYFPS